MKNILIYSMMFSFGLFISCQKEETDPIDSSGSTEDNNTTPSTSQNKIMPLGASRVEGAAPSYESYRYELWKDLKDGGFTFDFIGNMNDNYSYPQHNGQSFDIDHEGRGGWTSGQILAGIDGWISSAGAPDVVLFSSPGGNDGLQGLDYNQAISNVNAIIDKLQTANPNVTIIIEQMAPGSNAIMSGSEGVFLNQMNQDVVNIANQQTTSTSQVLIVDMNTGFNAGTMLADDVHYNQAGADFIASKYYSVLSGILQ